MNRVCVAKLGHGRVPGFPSSPQADNNALPRRSFIPAFTLFSWAVCSNSSGNANAAANGVPMMVEPDLPKFRRTSSGLKIQEVSEGIGPEARRGRIVEFNYVCRRSNGYYVYSTMDSFNKDSEPVTLALGEGKLISGLEEVITGMKSGGKRRVLIPPSLGYVSPDLEPQPPEFGPRRSLMAHAKEPLVFEIQLVRVSQ
ncbi:peptidyl-prolyl cis-trans isomerase FKBP16-1, chloroplastic isoform X1 [Selaginella moellendorffii]|nr:peptidyl-prolyl cis-trans isomerase FKBP16-1, chloroplastic isoform X1 [Selaginella moellendorffii]|eukprot:XP_002964205.2 peptidyl-prolyl cis-trans isomerase FKBP16-1, chloroplastic isoform X1 [Selaginella moellendorffii]